MIVGGEWCQGADVGTDCNIASKKTLLSKDGGLTFAELEDFPAEVEKTCGVFLNDTVFMVIGGREEAIQWNTFWLEFRLEERIEIPF